MTAIERGFDLGGAHPRPRSKTAKTLTKFDELFLRLGGGDFLVGQNIYPCYVHKLFDYFPHIQYFEVGAFVLNANKTFLEEPEKKIYLFIKQ